MTVRVRSPHEVAYSVWRALFLREALDRLFEARAAWLWLLAEPIIYIAIHAFGLETMHIHRVGGMSINMWIIAGFIGYLLWRRTWTQVMHGVDCNKAFFAYRQVKPFDVAFVRSVLELFLMVPVAIVVYVLAVVTGHAITPDFVNPAWVPADPLLFALSCFGLWILGLALGLVTSVAMHAVPEVDHIFKLLYLPLYYISGALFPLSLVVPRPYQYIFLINPVVHGVEMARLGFLPTYRPLQGANLLYLYVSALGLLLLGLALYKRSSRKLVMR